MRYLIESLPRIGSVGVYVDDVEELVLKELGPKALTVSYRGKHMSLVVKKTISLPVNISLSQNGVPTSFKYNEQGTFTLRLRVRSESVNATDSLAPSSEKFLWDKTQLNEMGAFCFRCLHCDAPVLDSVTNCLKLNNMPSEYWAELMDYWHCHKPDSRDPNISAKYGALKPLLNELLIGESFLETSPATVAGSTEVNDLRVNCSKCGTKLGELTKDGLYKFYKWQLKLYDNSKMCEYLFNPRDDVILQLLSYIRGYSGRYILLSSRQNPNIMLWVFALDIGVSFTDGKNFPQAVKILYTTDASQFDTIKKAHNVHELGVHDTPYTAFVTDLAQNHESLPEAAQKFDIWDTSYLPMP
ncbi:putative polyadenylation protein KNAG_0B06890 [Huiozyma naganishii CBS 8797]|uniref:Ubiquitin-conjugating enzyme E2C-binding protein n=1 Tax=Huiozyma naganishii (strain ATCC MYA-139 / BCRC 22969 / CBS 8797 / KCTC 17520 / NBRC 10181 / NCYC 3082 / Yp74L-3) TaxID=1071383 RepID=J7RHU2_HUIN7|nr:hypothetical protein KNAG_0B06890 [Kazachstania naganishii CBS 8797]CCK69113.1 hypothetical protein KNAG_0B06890 [Kazachstania naganishii CBS 8797]